MIMKVKIDDNCIGCGACTAMVPSVFALEDGKSVVIKQPETDDEKEKVKQAAELCPTQSIIIEEE